MPKIAIADFVTEYEGEQVELIAGISKIAEDDHPIVRAHPKMFASCRGFRQGMRAVSPSTAQLANPARARRLDETDLLAEGWDEAAVKRALNGDQTITRGPATRSKQAPTRLTKSSAQTPAGRAADRLRRERLGSRSSPRRLP
jgi:uncharacterized membrane protein